MSMIAGDRPCASDPTPSAPGRGARRASAAGARASASARASLGARSSTIDTEPATRARRARPGAIASRRWPRGIGAACAALATGLLAAGAASASSTTVTETFSATGAEQTLTVPAGVSHVRVRAIGEAGQRGSGLNGRTSFTTGGDGAIVGGELPVTAGEVLYVEVGAGGFGGGGAPGIGGGAGGAASDVRTVPDSEPATLESRVLVAAGGGGGGGIWESATGGDGGNAGSPGGTAISDETYSYGSAASSGGGAGTSTGGGAGGESCEDGIFWGISGSLGGGGRGGQEGQNPETGGGGGGGGYWGGGGGEGQCFLNPSPSGGGGGGGGGSSYASEEASSVSFGLASPATPPSVTISYQTPATATPSASSIEFAGTQPLTTVSAPQTITLTNDGGNPLTIDGVRVAGSEPALGTDRPEDFLVDSSGCLGAVAFEGSCEIAVRFVPQAAGPSTAMLRVEGDMGTGATVISLSGNGGGLPHGEPGTSGAQGQRGSAGPQGPRGEQGARGLTGTYICHRRQLHGRYKEACFVSMTSPPASAARASLRRAGIVFASGSLRPSDGRGHLLLQANRRVPAGSYTLVLASAKGVDREAVTIG